MNLEELLRATLDSGASDLHLKVGTVPYLRVDGELRPMAEQAKLSPEDIKRVVAALMNERQQAEFEATSQCDLAHSVPGLGRFRVNLFRQRSTVAVAIRVTSAPPASFEDLHLPLAVEKLAENRRGVILVTGVAGCGKSTTLAALVDRINSTRPAHIITIEDPIEFLHTDKLGLVQQREVRVDTPDFRSALREALRQDPDVILVGEMRDTETIQTALMAAETGHLVLSTLHTLDAAETVQRVIAVFPLDQQQQLRLMLAATLKGVISLRLLKRLGAPGRVPAVEVLMATDYIRDCIVKPEKTHLISQAIAAGLSQYGMQTFDQSLFDLYSQGLVSLEDALYHASRPDEFRLRVRGIRSRFGAPPDNTEPGRAAEERGRS